MRKLLTLLLFSSLLLAQDDDEDCGGKYRWNIKIASDSQASQISLKIKDTVSIAYLNTLMISDLKNKSIRTKVEMRVVTVKCRIKVIMRENDGDYHLALVDFNSDETMVAEVPDPNCINNIDSKFMKEIKIVRASIDAFVFTHKSMKLYFASEPYWITGILFIDKKHGQIGLAKNGMEIHPILKFERAK